MSKSSYVTITDQFCGAGGSSLGATEALEDAGELTCALNHWALAIETHNSNFPDALHDCTDISACDPRRYPSTTMLLTSPECTNHTLAKGQKKYQRGGVGTRDMFEGYGLDPAGERSRATMWDVPRFAEYHDYPIIIVENVVEARDWRMWESWWHAMTVSLGYDGRVVFLNSQFAWPTPQSRDRMYCVFWKRGQRAPNLDFRPLAWCGACGRNVEAVQSWKRPTRPWGRYERQYVYCCPVCAAIVRPYYYAAANAIDWTIPTPRIGDRTQPLKPKTIARIEAGLKKFGGQGLYLALNQSVPSQNVRPLSEPLPTKTTGNTVGWLIPFTGDPSDHPARPLSGQWPTQTGYLNVGLLVETNFSHAANNRSRGADQPWPAQTSQQSQALVTVPFLVRMTGAAGDPNGLLAPSDPLCTQVAASTQHFLVNAPFLVQMNGTNDARALDDPLSSVLAGGNHHALLQPAPFLLNYQGDARPLDAALATMTTIDRLALVQPTALPAVADCGFRILRPHEVGRAMAFPESYVVKGTGRQQVKQYGNAVTPPAMRLLVERCLESLN
jgi:DNA (cytosine-5)-methyltransferase 1